MPSEKRLRAESTRVLVFIIGITVVLLFFFLFSGEVLAAVFNNRFIGQGLDLGERFAKGFKPTVLAVFVVCYVAIVLIIARLISPLFRYLRTGEGYRKARTATISVPLWIMGVTFAFWIIGTTGYFILRNWDPESGLPYVWVLNMKLAGGVMAGLYISILLNIRLIRVKAWLDITDVREGENDIFSRVKTHVAFLATAYYAVTHLGYLAYFYAGRDAAVPLDVPFSVAFLSTAAAVFLLCIGLGAVMHVESSRQTRQLLTRLEDFAAGQADLSDKIPLVGFNDIGDVSGAFNRFVGRLASDIRSIHKNVARLQESSRVVAESAERLAGTAEQQAVGTRRISERTVDFSKAMSDIDSHVTEQASIARKNAESAQEQVAGMDHVVRSAETMHERTESSINSASKSFVTVRTSVERNIELAKRMEEVSRHMVAAGEMSHEVQGVLARITDIAEETNLLAVNASIEAAHAGHSGAGFAIVAHEIRELSSTTAEAVSRITELLGRIRDSLDVGAELAQAAREEGAETNSLAKDALLAIEAVVEVMEDSRAKLSDVANAAREQSAAVLAYQSETTRLRDYAEQIKGSVSSQSSGAADIRSLIGELERSHTESAEFSGELSKLAAGLAQAGEELARIVDRFKID